MNPEQLSELDKLDEMVAQLPDKERFVLKHVFGLEGPRMTQREIAKLLNLSAGYVSIIKLGAIRRLRWRMMHNGRNPSIIPTEPQVNPEPAVVNPKPKRRPSFTRPIRFPESSKGFHPYGSIVDLNLLRPWGSPPLTP